MEDTETGLENVNRMLSNAIRDLAVLQSKQDALNSQKIIILMVADELKTRVADEMEQMMKKSYAGL